MNNMKMYPKKFCNKCKQTYRDTYKNDLLYCGTTGLIIGICYCKTKDKESYYENEINCDNKVIISDLKKECPYYLEQIMETEKNA